MSKRANRGLRRLDASLGPVLIAGIGLGTRIRRFLTPKRMPTGGSVVVCFGAIGDLVLLSRVVQEAALHRPLVIACSAENEAVTEIFPDLYDAVVPVRLDRPWSLWQALRSFSVSAVYDSTQWANVSAVQLGFLKLLRPNLRLTGFRTRTRMRRLVYDCLVDHSRRSHETENFARLLGLPELDRRILVSGRAPGGRRVVLHAWPAGVRSHLKEWPVAHWVELARRLDAVGCTLHATGSLADQDKNRALIAAAQLPIQNLAGRLSLRGTYEFMRDSVDLCVSVNTGTMHIAALAGVHVVVVTGPTDPKRWGPIGPNAVSLLPQTGHRGYLHLGFEYPERDVDAYSLDRLSVDEVFGECLRALNIEA